MKLAKDIQMQRGRSRVVRIGAIGLLTLSVAAGANYGPELLDYYRFDQAIQASSRASEANAGPWPQPSQACVSCHGKQGNPLNQNYPRLAGQPASYLVQQLTAFASGQRSNTTMSPLARSFSAEDIAALATYFAAQPVSPNTTFVADAKHHEKGAQLAQTYSCSSCHGKELSGQGQFPRIAGQGYDYLVKQLHDFKLGVRKGQDGTMAAVAANLSDEDIKSLAQFIANPQ